MIKGPVESPGLFFALRKGEGRRAAIHDDLDAVANLDLGFAIEPVEHAETLGRVIDASHAVRQ